MYETSPSELPDSIFSEVSFIFRKLRTYWLLPFLGKHRQKEISQQTTVVVLNADQFKMLINFPCLRSQVIDSKSLS